jgi:hypothetical protein
VVEPLPLVRDVLDKQIYDVNHDKVGKVDGIVLIPRQGRPLRVAALQSDMPTAWRRVWQRLGDWVERLQQWLAPDLASPTRIAFEHVVGSGIDVDVDIDAKRTNAYVWETWLRRAFVEKIPGGKGSGEKGE